MHDKNAFQDSFNVTFSLEKLNPVRAPDLGLEAHHKGDASFLMCFPCLWLCRLCV